MATIRHDASAKLQRARTRALAVGSPLIESDLTLPGLEGIRGESRPLPEVAAAPFSLIGAPLPKPSRRARTTRQAQVVDATRPSARPVAGAPAPVRLPLLECLHVAEKAAAITLPGDGREALVSWFHAQEPVHGEEPWFARMTHAIAEEDWDRARKVAIAASCGSITRAYARARTPDEQDAILALVKRKPTATPEEC